MLCAPTSSESSCKPQDFALGKIACCVDKWGNQASRKFYVQYEYTYIKLNTKKKRKKKTKSNVNVVVIVGG